MTTPVTSVEDNKVLFFETFGTNPAARHAEGGDLVRLGEIDRLGLYSVKTISPDGSLDWLGNRPRNYEDLQKIIADNGDSSIAISKIGEYQSGGNIRWRL